MMNRNKYLQRLILGAENRMEWFFKIWSDTVGDSGAKRLENLVCLFPQAASLLYFRKGHVRKALKMLGRSENHRGSRQRFLERLTHMAGVLERGWPATARREDFLRPYNGKVVFTVHNSLPCDSAGYAIRSHQFLQALCGAGVDILAFTRPGYPWDLNVHASHPQHSRDVVDGIPYDRIPGNGASIFGDESHYVKTYGCSLAALAHRHNAAIIHAASNYMNGLAAATASRYIGGRSIYEMRGLWHLSRAVREPGYEETDHFHYCRIMELAAADEVDEIIAISSALKDHLLEEGIPSGKIKVISNAVDPDYFQPLSRDRELENRYGLTGRTVIGFIGSLTAYEGLDTLIRAFSLLENKKCEVSLVIVGKGYSEKRLKKLAEASPASRHIHFIGFIPHRDVKRYYSLMDVFPFPRTGVPVCRLVPPLKPLEAMAMAKAVIVSDLPPLTEMVHNGETGLVCTPEDPLSLSASLSKLIVSEDMRRRLGKNARAWVKRERSWGNTARRYLDVYRGVSSVE